MAPLLYTNPISPPVRAVLMAANAVGVQLEHKFVDFHKGEHLDPEFVKLNPQHTIPTLVDNGEAIWDSHAICAYLVGKYAKNDDLYPKDLLKRARIDQKLHFDTGNLYKCLYNMVKPMWLGTSYTILDEHKADTHESYKMLEIFLNGHNWVAGDSVTIADFCVIAQVTSLDILVPLDSKKYPNLTLYIKRAQSQPFYKENAGVEDYRKVLNAFLAKGKK